MKKTIIMVCLLLTINTFGKSDEKITIKEETKIELDIIDLQPITPTEATFEDVILNEKNLAPTTPKEATFEDEK